MEARVGRPPLTIVTNISKQQVKVHPRVVAVHKSRSKPGTPSPSSKCTMSPASSASASMTPPPAPVVPSSNNQKTLTPSSTPTATSRSRSYKYCADPDCSSPMTSNVLARVAESTSSRTASPSAASGRHTPMSSDAYFKLLKKSQVLEQLVQMSSHAGESKQQVRRLQGEQARAQCVQDRVFAELERYRRQVVDTQQQFLGLIEALTALCMREEELQGTATDNPESHDAVSAEEQTLLDLERASSPTAKSTSGSAMETQALATVGRQRVQQLEAICSRYERQLVGSEAALSQAIYSDAARESAAKIARLEARNLQHEADKQALEIQLELARSQAANLHEQLAHTQERRTTLEHAKQRLEQELTRHTTATQRFASDLQVELRRRYGVVPSVLELKWQHYFPRLSRPFNSTPTPNRSPLHVDCKACHTTQ